MRREVSHRCEWCGLRYTYALWVPGQGACCPICLRAPSGWQPAPPATGKLRRIAERDQWTCHLCQRPVPDYVQGPLCPTLDHLIPVSLGGSDALANLALAHWWCNNRRGNRPPPSFTLIEPWWPDHESASDDLAVHDRQDLYRLPDHWEDLLVELLARTKAARRSHHEHCVARKQRRRQRV